MPHEPKNNSRAVTVPLKSGLATLYETTFIRAHQLRLEHIQHWVREDLFRLIFHEHQRSKGDISEFHKRLKRVAEWDSTRIYHALKDSANKIDMDYFSKVLETVFAEMMMIFGCSRQFVNSDDPDKAIELTIPTYTDFVYQCFVTFAHELSSVPFLVTDMERSSRLYTQHRDKLNTMMNTAIVDTIRDRFLPLKTMYDASNIYTADFQKLHDAVIHTHQQVSHHSMVKEKQPLALCDRAYSSLNSRNGVQTRSHTVTQRKGDEDDDNSEDNDDDNDADNINYEYEEEDERDTHGRQYTNHLRRNHSHGRHRPQYKDDGETDGNLTSYATENPASASDFMKNIRDRKNKKVLNITASPKSPVYTNQVSYESLSELSNDDADENDHHYLHHQQIEENDNEQHHTQKHYPMVHSKKESVTVPPYENRKSVPPIPLHASSTKNYSHKK